MNASKDYESQYMIIEALEDDFSVSLNGDDDVDSNIEYSIDGKIWNILEFGQTTTKIDRGMQFLLKGEYTYNSLRSISFLITKQCNLKGNCMALLGDRFAIINNTLEGRGGAFYGLFINCTGIISVGENFLPATTLSPNCYNKMFAGCTNLIKAPELPVTILAESCYNSMFDGCTKLNYIKMLATDISANNCLIAWVNGVASSGTFVKNPEATWEVYGDDGIPNGWKVVMDGEESNLKSFQVDYLGDVEEFYFEDGMTWGEWVDSEYNNGDYAVDEIDDSICKLEFDIRYGWIGDDYGYVLSSDIILEKTYYLMS